MVAILKGVLFGILIYVAVIPIIEELATVIVQALEVLKGKLILHLTVLQDKADRIKEKKQKTSVHAIGFSVPNDEEEIEEDYEEDD